MLHGQPAVHAPAEAIGDGERSGRPRSGPATARIPATLDPMKLPAPILLAVALAGCAASPDKGAGSGATSSAVTSAATTPLADLNLVHGTIPAVLADAQKQPYRMPADGACVALAAEVRALDEALGPDLDAPAVPGNPGLLERSGDAAGSLLKNAAEGVVPFRGWVRKLTGAERYSKDVAAAIAAGSVRRGFLKGLRSAKGC